MKLKTKLVLFAILLMSPIFIMAQENRFITIWQIEESNQTITIPLEGSYLYEWSMNAPQTPFFDNGFGIGDLEITFLNPGEYVIKLMPNMIVGTPLHRINLGDADEETQQSIKEVKNWGNIEWGTFMVAAFEGCTNLEITATDIPNLSGVENMFKAFAKTGISTVPNMNDWDVSNVEDMGGLFEESVNFNENIGNWNTSSLKYMDEMFYGATSFNKNINSWDISGVHVLTDVFRNASSFNQDLSNWDVSNVTIMESTFEGASSFNQDISSWNVSNVTKLLNTFSGASSFDQNLGSWEIKSLIDGSYAGANGLFDNSGMSCENYSLTIQGWAENPNTPDNIKLGAEGIEYSPEIINDRDYLINDLGWTIQGDVEGDCSLEDDELGINEDFINQITLYPNPTSNYVTLSGLSGDEIIEVVDMNGKILKVNQNTDFEKIELDLSQIQTGIYIVKISNKKGGFATKKLIKE